jgi:hypothetical protein
MAWGTLEDIDSGGILIAEVEGHRTELRSCAGYYLECGADPFHDMTSGIYM